MKPFKKVVAALLAVLLIVATAGCSTVSLSKEWCYEYNDSTLSEKLDAGVYIYSLYQAYNSAKTYAENSDDYKEDESFMDIEITDDDGNKAVAKDWIKTEAEKITMNLIAIDYLVAKNDATWDEATMTSAKDTAKDTWDMGPYASYGYYQPMSDELEPYGVSYDSFELASYVANVKQSAVFNALYNEGGEKAVSDAQLTKYFTKNYVDYSYIPVNMYTSETNDDGDSTSVALSKKKIASIVSTLEDYATKLNNGETTFAKALKACVKDVDASEDSAVTDTVELYSTTKSNNSDVAKAVKSLDNGKAKVITVGTDGDSPIAYLVMKNNIKDDVNDYIKSDTNRSTVLQNMKSDEFTDYLEDVADELLKSDALSKNSGVIDRYDPNMFFTKAEETTSADDDTDTDSDTEE
jgi:hypothetical protein